MRKKTLILLLFFIFAAAGTSVSQVKVAFVDSDIIIKQLPEAQEVQKKLEDLQKLYVDTVTTKENDIKTKADALKTKYEDAQRQVQDGKLTPEQVQALETEITNMQVEVQKLDQDLADYKQEVQKVLLNTQAELFKPVKDKITKVIEQVARELKYNYVLDKASDAMIYGDKDMDITFKVLDKLK